MKPYGAASGSSLSSEALQNGRVIQGRARCVVQEDWSSASSEKCSTQSNCSWGSQNFPQQSFNIQFAEIDLFFCQYTPCTWSTCVRTLTWSTCVQCTYMEPEHYFSHYNRHTYTALLYTITQNTMHHNYTFFFQECYTLYIRIIVIPSPGKPSCEQTTVASSRSHESSQTVPQ